MESFYKEWLKKSDDENKEAASHQIQSVKPIPTTSAKEPINENQSAEILPAGLNPGRVTDIVFENNDLQLIVEQAALQRQKRFRFQDHLFHVKIKLKDETKTVPFLKDILDFLQEGLLHLMQNT